MNDHIPPLSHSLRALYGASFLFGAMVAIPTYINSTFLSTFVSEAWVGIAFALGSGATLLTLPLLPAMLRRYGNYRVMMALLGALIVATLVLAFSRDPLVVISAFVLYLCIISVAIFPLDIFIESNSKDASTGSIRGTALTAINAAFIASPAIAGILLTNGDYWKIYALAAGCSGALMILLARTFRNFRDPHYEQSGFMRSLRAIRANKDIWRIFMANVILKFFYAWMVIYTPIYLHEYIGFEWDSIGVMFAIMLLPFVLFEIPAGRLADSKWGEKEMLIGGFLIMAISTGALSFLSSASFILWAGLLFITRTGAAIVEIMTESYFFKHIGGKDAAIVSFFRNTNPIAYLAGPAVASAFLAFFDFSLLFLALSGITLAGILYALRITDTK